MDDERMAKMIQEFGSLTIIRLNCYVVKWFELSFILLLKINYQKSSTFYKMGKLLVYIWWLRFMAYRFQLLSWAQTGFQRLTSLQVRTDKKRTCHRTRSFSPPVKLLLCDTHSGDFKFREKWAISSWSSAEILGRHRLEIGI